MFRCLSTDICLPFDGSLARDTTNTGAESWSVQDRAPCDRATAHDELQVKDERSPSTTSIHILDDDSLLHVFCLYRPVAPEDDEGNNTCTPKRRGWGCERWWYKLAHVCKRWRYLMLASASYLRLCLVCTYDTPVEDMLAHFPPFPLIVDYFDKGRGLNAEDEEGIWHALQHRGRLRRIRLWVPNSHLRKLVMAIDGEYPALEYLFLGLHQKPDRHLDLTLRDTFQAPHLHHLMFIHFPFPSPALTTTTGLVTLSLSFVPHLHPYDLLEQLLLMPHLETLEIALYFHLSTHDTEMQQLHTPPLIHVTLANLRWFGFKGSSFYLEALLPAMTTPLLERLQITFFNQRSFSVPHLLQYISDADNLKFTSAKFSFTSGGVVVSGCSHGGAKLCILSIHVLCGRLDWQVLSMIQIFNVLSPVFSAVLDLTLDYGENTSSLEQHGEAGNILADWSNLLRPFNNVRTLRVNGDLVGALSHSLRWNGEPLLPELKEVICPGGGHAGDELMTFISARRIAGQPVHPVYTDVSESSSTNTRKSRRIRLSRFIKPWS